MRALHSFPTRRSSDLPGLAAGYGDCSALECFNHAVWVAAHIRMTRATHVHAHFAHDPALVGMLDRKSTRLNSSHGYISYAVFCLKQKRNDVPIARRHS